MKKLVCALFVFLGASSAHADVVLEPMRTQPAPTVRLSSVRVSASRGVPRADVAAVEREARTALRRRRSRIQRCLAGVDLRRDPLRSRPRSLAGRLVFARSRRPTVHIDRVRGVPAPARSCIMEAVRGVAVRTTPRGSVEVSFRYTVN